MNEKTRVKANIKSQGTKDKFMELLEKFKGVTPVVLIWTDGHLHCRASMS